MRDGPPLTQHERARIKRCVDCNVYIGKDDNTGWYWERGETRRGGFKDRVDAADHFLATYDLRKSSRE